jgi:ubiquinone/menaquinone biosynthesis C-methylase UbiE
MRLSVTTNPQGHWFEAMADHMGEAYLRYSFTKGTTQEVRFVIEQLGLKPGDRVLDVGCGPGRHALALATHGVKVVGVDISQRFVDLGNQSARSSSLEGTVQFVKGDARNLPFNAEFDAVISLCQGGFGLVGRTEDGACDDAVLNGMAAALKPGGRLGVSAFSAYFMLRHLEDHDAFDANTGVNHERTEIRNADGVATEVDLWTTCFTPRELRLLLERAGLSVEAIHSVTPGAYEAALPSSNTPEFFAIASKPPR